MKKIIFDILETFVGETFDKFLFSSTTQAAICKTCLEKIEEYDRICLQAAQIQDEISQKFAESQAKLQDSREDLLKCKTCLAQCADYEDMNSHECVISINEDFDTYVEFAESSDELNEIKSEGSKPSNFNYTCNVCQEKFIKKKSFQHHSKFAHLPEDAEIFSCSQCSEDFVSEMDLQLHVVIAHPDDPTSAVFRCPICPKQFTKKALLNRHFGIHSSTDRPFVCEQCGKNFFHSSSFQAHIKVHNDERSYMCSICMKSFRSQSHLNRHVKTHTKQKDHECPGKLFKI